jgi:hypothetical protein
MKRYRPSHWPFLLVLGVAVLLIVPGRQAVAAADAAAVWDLVHHHYVHGLPYAEAEALGPDAVDFLLPMLSDPAEEEWWHNVVIALGIVGGGEVTQPLVAFFESWHAGEVTRETFMAVASVPAALGFVAAKGDPAAMEYVKACTRVGFFAEKKLLWRAPGMDLEELHTFLSQIAIKGLGYSAKPEAAAHLRGMLERPESAAVARVLESDIQEAIETNQLIAANGPRSHFHE